MELKRSCRLVLKSTDLSLGATTNIGTMDGFRTTFTWSNLNLRMLMGDMYNQYDYFNLCLNCVATLKNEPIQLLTKSRTPFPPDSSRSGMNLTTSLRPSSVRIDTRSNLTSTRGCFSSFAIAAGSI